MVSWIQVQNMLAKSQYHFPFILSFPAYLDVGDRMILGMQDFVFAQIQSNMSKAN